MGSGRVVNSVIWGHVGVVNRVIWGHIGLYRV